MKGTTVFSERHGNGVFEINVEALPKGLYVIRVTGCEKNEAYKVLKQ